MNHRIILVTIILNDINQILLIKRKRDPGIGKWSLPGGEGALEHEPDPLKAAAMEVKNDFDVEYINYKLLTLKYTDAVEPTLRLYFYGRIEGIPQMKSTKTIQELRWFTVADALDAELAFEETDKEVLHLLQKTDPNDLF